MLKQVQIEACACAAHEANRAYSKSLGDESHAPWNEVPEWHRLSILSGVRRVLAGETPEQNHQSWFEDKVASGWKYGPVKDVDKKEHPCLLPYAELPVQQQAKDQLFASVVWAMAHAFGEWHLKEA